MGLHLLGEGFHNWFLAQHLLAQRSGAVERQACFDDMICISEEKRLAEISIRAAAHFARRAGSQSAKAISCVEKQLISEVAFPGDNVCMASFASAPGPYVWVSAGGISSAATSSLDPVFYGRSGTMQIFPTWTPVDVAGEPIMVASAATQNSSLSQPPLVPQPMSEPSMGLFLASAALFVWVITRTRRQELTLGRGHVSSSRDNSVTLTRD